MRNREEIKGECIKVNKKLRKGLTERTRNQQWRKKGKRNVSKTEENMTDRRCREQDKVTEY